MWFGFCLGSGEGQRLILHYHCERQKVVRAAQLLLEGSLQRSGREEQLPGRHEPKPRGKEPEPCRTGPREKSLRNGGGGLSADGGGRRAQGSQSDTENVATLVGRNTNANRIQLVRTV